MSVQDSPSSENDGVLPIELRPVDHLGGIGFARGLKVLVAEDDLPSRELLQYLLEGIGCTVVGLVENGRQAVEQTLELKPDLVVMDLSMPELDGVAATRAIQELRPTPVVVLSAFHTYEWVRDASEAGAGAYIVKPARGGELERAIAVSMARFEDMVRLRHVIADLKESEAERQELEREVQRRQQIESLSVLAGGVAHDFNNLLAVMLGNAELALLDAEQGSKLARRVEAIKTAAERAAKLSSQMLAFSGHGRLETANIDLLHLLQDEVERLRQRIPESVGLVIEHPGKPVEISADRSQIRKLVSELLANSVEAIGDNRGRVSVQIELVDCEPNDLDKTFLNDQLPGGEYARLRVTDNGHGMDSNAQERAFDPFFSTRFAGRGLGLPVVLGIVRGHRGAVDIDSQPEIGTVVTVFLPTRLTRTGGEGKRGGKDGG